MRKRDFITMFLVGILILLLTGCSNNSTTETSQTTNKFDEENNNSSMTISSTLKLTTFVDNNTEPFSYPIKDFYSSRKEIEAEKDAITKSYYQFEVGKDSQTREKAKETYRNYMKIMSGWLDRYPPEEDEILAEKERLLKQKVFFEKDDLYIAENNLANNSPEKAEEILKKARENYENAVEVQKLYDAGEITIDEALEKLNIPPSKMLQEYYEQHESAE